MTYSKTIKSLFLIGFILWQGGCWQISIYANDLEDAIRNIRGRESQFCTEKNVDNGQNIDVETNCFFPDKSISDQDIYIENQISWHTDSNLIIRTRKNIIFKSGGKIINNGHGSVVLMAGMEPGKTKPYDGTVMFEEPSQIEMLRGGKVKIYYNPSKGKERHKYHNPTIFSTKLPRLKIESYMLVNSVYDLQGITACLSCNYALSQNIDASITKTWNDGKGFIPIKGSDHTPFSGSLYGNNYTIENLYINRPEEDMVGLFGSVTGYNEYFSKIKHLNLNNVFIRGKTCVAVIAHTTGIEVDDIHLKNEDIRGESKVGFVMGCILNNSHKNISASSTMDSQKLIGSCLRCKND